MGFLALSAIFWAFGMQFAYLLFISRLRLICRSSVYKVSKYLILSIYGAMFLLLVLTLTDTFWFFKIMYQMESTEQLLSYAAQARAFFIAAECLHLFISLLLTWTFVSKLLHFVHNTSLEFMKKRHYGSTHSFMCEQDIDKCVEFSIAQQSILHIT